LILLVGLSHRTCPLELRERVVLDERGVGELLDRLKQDARIEEALVLSTCNRVEVVVAGPKDRASLRAAVLELWQMPESVAQASLYVHEEREAIFHLFRVTASLDSLVVGEPQILGQVKAAHEAALRHGTLGECLRPILARCLRAGKRVRAETSIGEGQVSVASVAVSLVRQVFEEVGDRRVCLLGSGEMAETIAGHLAVEGAKVVVLGRNRDRVEELARRTRAEPGALEQLEEELSRSDVVLTSTSAPRPIVTVDMVRRTGQKRRGRDLLFVDLAVPRDVEAEVNGLEGVYLFNIDDLSQVTAKTQDGREVAARAAEQILREELARFEVGQRAGVVEPMVRALFEYVARVHASELERSLAGRLRCLSHDEREGIEMLLEASKKKLLHEPVTRLRQLASDDPEAASELVRALGELFGIAFEGEQP